MRTLPSRALAAAVIATVGLFGLAGCASGDNEPAPKPKKTSETSNTDKKKDAEKEDAPTAEGQPAWASPVTTPGELITTIEMDNDFVIEVYQVGVAKATKPGQFVDPDTNKPIIAEGDEIVFVNYVITNNGDPVDLGSSLVGIEARYDDWPYVQGMDSVVDSDLFKAQNVNEQGLAPGSFVTPSVYTFGSGEQFSFGENFPYQSGSSLTIDVTVTPVDAEGKLIHDKKVKAESKAKIA